MRAHGLVALLLLGGGMLAAGQEGWTFPKEPYAVEPLELRVAVPEGWTTQHNRSGMVASDAEQNGFLVSREPFLHDPEEFAGAWARQLAAGDKDTKVEAVKVGRLTAWRAGWDTDDGKRRIEVWRLYVPGAELLYNFSFTARPDLDLEPLVQRVLKSFRCTAPKPELRFARNPVSVGTSFALKLPAGYEKAGRGLGLGEVGLYYNDIYLRYLAGYKEPHLAGRIAVRGLTADRPIGLGRTIIQPGNVKDLVQAWWENVESKAVDEVVGKPKTRTARVAGMKGASLTATARVKGLPKRVHLFVGKLKRNLVIITIVVDEREVRRQKDLARKILSTLKATR